MPAPFPHGVYFGALAAAVAAPARVGKGSQNRFRSMSEAFRVDRNAVMLDFLARFEAHEKP